MAHGFEDTNGGVDGNKYHLYAKKWDVYILKEEAFVKGGHLVEVYNKDGKKVIWEVVDEHVVEEGVEHEEIVLQGFDFDLFNEEREGCVEDHVKELPYLLIFMKLWPEDWEDQIEQMNKKVDEENGRGWTQENRQFWKLWRFSRNELWNNIGYILSATTFGLVGLILW